MWRQGDRKNVGTTNANLELKHLINFLKEEDFYQFHVAFIPQTLLGDMSIPPIKKAED